MEATIFIGAIIAGLTQSVKLLSPKVSGIVTIIVAIIVGIVIAIIDVNIGIVNITIAEGVFIALGTVGVVTTVSKVG